MLPRRCLFLRVFFWPGHPDGSSSRTGRRWFSRRACRTPCRCPLRTWAGAHVHRANSRLSPLLPLAGGREFFPPWALSRAIFIISQSDMNIYRKTILMGRRWTAEPLAPASGPARIQASPESPTNYNGGRIVVVSSGCESRSTQRNTNGPAAAGPACNVFKSARNTVAGKPVNWRSEP